MVVSLCNVRNGSQHALDSVHYWQGWVMELMAVMVAMVVVVGWGCIGTCYCGVGDGTCPYSYRCVRVHAFTCICMPDNIMILKPMFQAVIRLPEKA